MPIEISVLICTYNRASLLRGTLDSVLRQTGLDGRADDTHQPVCGNSAPISARCGSTASVAALPRYEVIVVDNASTDETRAVVEEVAATAPVPVRYVYEPREGVAQARNRGVAEATGQWIAVIDDDEVAEPDWLIALYGYAVETNVQLVGGAVRLLLPPATLARLPRLCREYLGESVGREQAGRCRRNEAPGAGNLLVHRSVFERVGGFDPGADSGGEDTRFITACRLAGIDAWFTPAAVIHHTVPDYRLEARYLTWAAMRYGDAFARRDAQEVGLWRTVGTWWARLVQAVGIDAPLWLGALVLGRRPAGLARKCRLWKAVGYSRRVLALLVPRWLPQGSFFRGLKFRGERATYADGGALPACGPASSSSAVSRAGGAS